MTTVDDKTVEQQGVAQNDENKLLTLPNGVLFNKIADEKEHDAKEANSLSDTIDAELDYKNIEFLMKYLSDGGKILPRRNNNFTKQQQRKLRLCVIRARQIGLLPYKAS